MHRLVDIFRPDSPLIRLQYSVCLAHRTCHREATTNIISVIDASGAKTCAIVLRLSVLTSSTTSFDAINVLRAVNKNQLEKRTSRSWFAATASWGLLVATFGRRLNSDGSILRISPSDFRSAKIYTARTGYPIGAFLTHPFNSGGKRQARASISFCIATNVHEALQLLTQMNRIAIFYDAKMQLRKSHLYTPTAR